MSLRIKLSLLGCVVAACVAAFYLMGRDGDGGEADSQRASSNDNASTSTLSRQDAQGAQTRVVDAPRRPSLPAPLRAHGTAPEVEAMPQEGDAEEPPGRSDFSENLYVFRKTVLAPRMLECWKDVKGKGSLNSIVVYEVVGGIAKPAIDPETGEPDVKLDPVVENPLDSESTELGMACLRKAVAGTEFEYVGLEGEVSANEELTGFWSWPTMEQKPEIWAEIAASIH